MKKAIHAKLRNQLSVMAALCFLLLGGLRANGQILWSSAAGSAWLGGTNWTGGAEPTGAQIAVFGANPTSATAGVGINMNGSTNNGSNNQAIGAIHDTSTRTINILVGNSSTTSNGTLTLNGAIVRGVANVILANYAGSNGSLTLQNTQGGGNKTMDVNIGSGSKTILTQPSASATAISNTIAISSKLTGSAALTFLGGGTWVSGTGVAGGLLSLSNSGNTASGGITVGSSSSTYNSGILSLDNAGAISNTSGNNITINPFSQLYLNATTGSTFAASNINLNINGVGNGITTTYGEGAIRTAGTNAYTWNGPINVATDATISVGTSSAASLTVTGNISGSGQLTKAGLGNLVLSSGTNSWSGGTRITGGLITVNSGTALPTGDLIFSQASTNPTTVTLLNASQTVSNLRSRWTAITGTIAQTFSVSASSILTINQTIDTVFGDGAATTLKSVFAGAGKIVKTGSGRLTLTSGGTASLVTGGIKVNAGEIRFNPTAALANTAPDTLNGGSFSTVGLSVATVSLGSLTLTDNSVINLDPSTPHQLRFAASNSNTWTTGKTLLIYGWNGTYGTGTVSSVTKVFFGTTGVGLTPGQLAQIFFVDGSGNKYPAAFTSGTFGEIAPTVVNYYSKSTGNLDNLATWGTSTDGSGLNPVSFTSNYQQFNIANNNSCNITTSPWTVSGTNSKVVVSNSDLTIYATKSITATVDINAGRTATIFNTTLPTFGTLNATSTIVFKNNTANTIDYTKTYGNLTFDSTGTGINNTAGVITYAGNFTVQNSASINASSVDLRSVGTLDQVISGNGNTLSIGTLKKTRLEKTAGKLTLNANTPITVNGNVMMYGIAGTNAFVDNGNTITALSNLILAGDSVGYVLTGTFRLTGNNTTVKISGDTAAQSTYARANFNHLEIATTGTTTTTFMGATTNAYNIRGNFTVTSSAGVVFSASNVINICGDFTYTPTTDVISYSTAAVISFRGYNRQNYTSGIASTGNTIPRITMGNTSVVGLVLNSPLTVSAALTLTTGKIRTGANTLFFTPTGAIGTSANPSSYVYGNLSEGVLNASTITKIFPIGDTTFSPVRLTATGATTSGGAIIASSIYGDHPNLGTSSLNGSSYLKRYVSFTNNGVAGPTAIKLDWSYSNSAPDMVGGTDNSNFLVRIYNDSEWITPGTLSTNTTGLGVTGMLSYASVYTSIPFANFFKTYANGIPTCNGTPSSGTATMTPGYRFLPGTFAFSVSGSSIDPTYTYQWYTSTDGVNYTAISGATSTTYTTPTISASTYYRYQVKCTANNRTSNTDKVALVLTAAPQITSLSPNIAAPGTTVNIHGAYFNSTYTNNRVTFGATKVIPTAGTDSTLTVVVPSGALYGPVTVTDTVLGQTGNSGHNVGYAFAPFLPIFDSTGFLTDTLNFRNAVNITTSASTGNTPYTGAIDDVDGDGRPDLVVNNRGVNTISILMNKMTGPGQGSFITTDSFQLQSTVYTTLGSPNNVKLADLDGDGKLDMIIANQGALYLSIYRNLSTPGNPSFGTISNRIDIPVTTIQAVVSVADFDGDGKPDIAFTGGNVFNPSLSSNTVKILKNLIPFPGSFTSGSFQLVDSITATGAITTGLAIADFDGDGLPDVAMTCAGYTASDNIVNIARNTSSIGAVSFATPIVANGNGSGATDVTAGDFDNDGKPDLVMTNYFSSSVSTLRNTTTGTTITFALPQSVVTGASPIGVAVADLNGDKKLDLVVSNYNSNSLSVYRNITTDSNISFSWKKDFNSGSVPTTVTIGDLNGDRFPDLVVGNQGATTLSIFQNYPLPRIFAIDGPSNVCPTATIALSDTVTGGTWTSADTLRATVNASTGVVTGVTAGNVNITYTVNVQGNTRSVYKTITVYPLPFSGSIFSSPLYCPGDTADFNITGATDPGVWSSGNIAVATINATTGIVTGVAYGTVNITYTVTSSLGCGTDDTFKTITITAPTAGVVSGTTTFCQATTSTLTSSGDAGGRWTSSNTAVATVDSLTGAVYGVSSGTANITYTVYNVCATVRASTSVTILPLANPGLITGASFVCLGGNTPLSNAAVGGVWSSATPTIASVSASGVVSGLSLGNTIISYTVTNSCGSVSDTASIAVTTVPGIATPITGTTTICAGSNTMLTNATVGGVWSSSNTAQATVNTGGVVTGIAAGSPVITYTVANSCGTSDTFLNITIIPAPTAAITSVAVPCSGYGVTIGITGTSGATIQYQIDGGTNIDSVLVGGSLSIITPVITSSHNYTLHAVTNGYCILNIDTTIAVAPVAMKWVGGTSGHETDWNTASNWNCGTVPGAGDNITIPYTTYAPVVAASTTVYANNATIDTSVIVTLNTGAIWNVAGSLANNNKVVGAGTLSMAGASAQNITGLGKYDNLTINNASGVTIAVSSRVTVNKVLTVSAGMFTTNDSLIMNADTAGASQSRVAAMGASTSITGTVRVLTYIQGGFRRYRFWSHSFSNTIGLNQLAASIDVTGAGGVANGFTATATNAPSVYRYATTRGNSDSTYDPGWKPFTSALAAANDSNRIARYQGVRVYMRGAKGEGLGYIPYTPHATVIAQWGTLNQGRQVVSLVKGLSTGQEHNLLGNPYASPVDLGTVLHNAKVSGNIVGSFFVWNPTLGSGGQFQAYPISTVTPTPFYIKANSAFEVRAAHNGDSLVFNEANKNDTGAYALLRTQPEYTVLNVYDANYHPWDILQFKFNNEADENQDDNDDAGKLIAGDLNFYSFSADHKRQAIDARPYIADKVIPLGITSNVAQEFIIKAESVVLPQNGTLYLHDRLLNQYVQLNEGTEYRFAISKDKNSQGDSRFELSMKAPVAVTATTNTGLSMELAPNPASSDVVLNFTSGTNETVKVAMRDINGVTIFNKDFGAQQSGSTAVALKNIAAGVYFVEITSGNEKVVKRLIKN